MKVNAFFELKMNEPEIKLLFIRLRGHYWNLEDSKTVNFKKMFHIRLCLCQIWFSGTVLESSQWAVKLSLVLIIDQDFLGVIEQNKISKQVLKSQSIEAKYLTLLIDIVPCMWSTCIYLISPCSNHCIPHICHHSQWWQLWPGATYQRRKCKQCFAKCHEQLPNMDFETFHKL